MNIICWFRDGADIGSIRVTKADQKDLNLSELYIQKQSEKFKQTSAPSVIVKASIDNADLPDSILEEYYLIATLNRETAAYWIYSLQCLSYIAESNLSLSVTASTNNYVTTTDIVGMSLAGSTALVDEHSPIKIDDNRNISTNSVVLLAGDVKSQIVTFEIDECYDGISILDEEKTIWVNFQLPNDPTLWRDEIKIRNRKAIDSRIIELSWVVHESITVNPGVVQYNLSVGGKKYKWHTKSSSFTVLPNLFANNIPTNAEEAQSLSARVAAIEEGYSEKLAQNIGEYLATDSQSAMGDGTTEIVFDANWDMEG